MSQTIAQYFINLDLPKELITFLLALLPVTELRLSIPIALEVFHLPVWSAYLFSVLGNWVPLVLIISVLDPISLFLRKRIDVFEKIFAWLFAHTKRINQSKFEKWGKDLTVIILVATPVPFIGGWTGAVAAFVFGIPFKRALPLVTAGVLIAGLIVTILTLGIFKII